MNYAENKAAAADFGVAKVIGGRFFSPPPFRRTPNFKFKEPDRYTGEPYFGKNG